MVPSTNHHRVGPMLLNKNFPVEGRRVSISQHDDRDEDLTWPSKDDIPFIDDDDYIDLLYPYYV